MENETPVPVTESNTNKTMAIFALILGIVSLCAWFLPICGFPIAIIGIVLAVFGLKSTQKAIAIVAIVLCSIGLALSVGNSLLGLAVGIKDLDLSSDTPKSDIKFKESTAIDARSATQSSNPLLSSKAYVDSRDKYLIFQPKGWVADTDPESGIDVIFYSDVQEVVDGRSFKSNINIAKGVTTTSNLDAFVAESKKSVSGILDEYKLLEDQRVIVDNRQAGLISGTFMLSGAKIRNYQLLVRGDDTSYVVTATTLDSVWDKYSSLMKASLMTFDYE